MCWSIIMLHHLKWKQTTFPPWCFRVVCLLSLLLEKKTIAKLSVFLKVATTNNTEQNNSLFIHLVYERCQADWDQSKCWWCHYLTLIILCNQHFRVKVCHWQENYSQSSCITPSVWWIWVVTTYFIPFSIALSNKSSWYEVCVFIFFSAGDDVSHFAVKSWLTQWYTLKQKKKKSVYFQFK